MKKVLLSAVMAVATLGGVNAQNSDEVKMKAINAVTPYDIQEWCEKLVSAEFRGRGTGDIGYERAAQWTEDQYKAMGLKPMGDNGSYQSVFPQPSTKVLAVGSITGEYIMGKDTLVKEYQYLKDYFPTGLSASGKVKGEVVFAGSGISAPELGFDAYKGVDVEGKVVILDGGMTYKGTNQDTLQMWAPYLRTSYKVKEADRRGAAAVLFVNALASCAPNPDADIVVAYASPLAVNDMLKGTGTTIEQLRKDFKEGKYKSVKSKNKVTVEAHAENNPNSTSSNVVAVIEGSDPVLKNEYVMIGAHLDHLGMLPEIYEGALDNASGVAITLGIAKALVESGAELKRSVIFVNYGAEEVGLVGAKHFAAKHKDMLKDIKLVVNLDMVGKGKGFNVAGTFHAKPNVEIFKNEISKWVHRPMSAWSFDKWQYNTYPRTDGGVFENLKVPVIYFSMLEGYKGIYYHHPLDKLNQLDYTQMKDVVSAIAVSVMAEANK